MKATSTVRILVALVLVSALAIGCVRKGRQRLAVAFVIDLTASVDSGAVRAALDSLDPLLDGKKLKRGDSVIVIPITGDTLTESQGKVLRIHLSETRQVYDADLKTLGDQVRDKLRTMQTEVVANPFMHSDILGAADLAAEELAGEQGNVRRVIVVLSDFIQDDSQANFNTSPDLANDGTATDFARKLAAQHTAKFAGATVYLGMLRSKDLKKMPNARRSAVQTFWREYFKLESAQSVSFAIDGPGRVPTILEQTE